MIFEVLTAIAILLNVTPCILVDGHTNNSEKPAVYPLNYSYLASHPAGYSFLILHKIL
jgi:hypothetical protein